jgi:hypothetical protein
MPVHDWSCVSAGTFHDFHNSWIVELKRVLNQELQPEGYYAQSEQDAWDVSPDVLTLQGADDAGGRPFRSGGAAAVAASPPQVSIALLQILPRATRTGLPGSTAFWTKLSRLAGWLPPAGYRSASSAFATIPHRRQAALSE